MQTTQHFWKFGEFIAYVENRFGEESAQYLDVLGYDPDYLNRIRIAYARCKNMKRKDLSMNAYRVLSSKDLDDEDRDLLAEKFDGLTRGGFDALVKEHLVVIGKKSNLGTQSTLATNDNKKTIDEDEVDDLIHKGEALLSAMPEDERHAAINCYLESKNNAPEPSVIPVEDDTQDVFTEPGEQALEEAAARGMLDANAVCVSEEVWKLLEEELAYRVKASRGMDATLDMQSVGEMAIRRGLKVMRSDWARKR